MAVPPGRAGRVLSPAGMLLALLCFALGFLTVSCEVPGGYGRAAPGGTTTYTGVDLAVGGAPSVDEEHLLPAGRRQDDDLGVQPLVALAFLLVAAGATAGAVGVVRRFRHRHLTVGGLAAAGMVTLAAGAYLAERALEDRVLAAKGGALPGDADVSEYVGAGRGLWLCLALLALVVSGHLAAAAIPPARRPGARRRARRAARAGPATTGPPTDAPPSISSTGPGPATPGLPPAGPPAPPVSPGTSPASGS